MIAKVKATGEIIDVEYNDGWIRRTEPQSWIIRDEIEILGYTEEEVKQRIDRAKKDHIEDNLEMVGNPDHVGESTEKVDWDYWRMKYAGDFMIALIESGNIRYSIVGNIVERVAKLADDLIEQLKKTK
jgi:hypothetical protein